MSKSVMTHFEDAWHALLELLPQDYEVSWEFVRKEPAPGKRATVDHFSDHADIKIKRGCMEMMLESLVHEFAHILDWLFNPTRRDEHRQSWGRWYSICYKVVYER